MSQDMNNKDSGNFTFIQEQIASKRKGKIKRMLFSFAWSVILAGVFGIVAAFVFCVSEPRINKMIGKNDGKKEVEFPTQGADTLGEVVSSLSDAITSTPPASLSEGVSEASDKSSDNTLEEEEKQPETVIIEQRVDGNLEDLENIYGELKRINNSYYKSLVTVTGITSEIDWHDNEVDFSTVTSGLVIAENGADILVLVNYDKIADTKNIQVTIWDSTSFEGRIQGYDKDLNIAIVAVSLENFTKEQIENLQFAELGESYNISLGEPILALGAPNGYVGSMGFGIISNKLTSRYITDGKLDIFHTDIDSNENSEGIIVDLNGTVVGIITKTLKDSTNPNVTTAIGISKIKKVIQSLVNEKERAYFGIKAMDMPEDVTKQYDITSGIYVSEVLANSPALESGVQIGDIILSVNDSPVMSVQAFQNIISMNEPKNVLKVKVIRTTKSTDNQMEFDVALGKKSGS